MMSKMLSGIKFRSKFTVNNTTYGKIYMIDLLKLPVEIPKIQRMDDTTRIQEIADYQKNFHIRHSFFNMAGVITLGVSTDSPSIYLMDGQHRYKAIKLLGTEGYNLENEVVLNVIKTKTYKELDEYFKVINKSMPAPELPEHIDKEVYKNVFRHYENTYSNFFSNSKRPRRPNINRTQFKEALGLLVEKLNVKTDKELIEIIDKQNEIYETQSPQDFPIKGSAANYKILEKVKKKGGFYLGMYPYNSSGEDNMYEWVNHILIRVLGITFEPPHLSKDVVKNIKVSDPIQNNKKKSPRNKKKKKKNIPKARKNLVWNTHIGKEYGVALCFCCRNKEIEKDDFQAGHILAEANGGSIEIDNLVPICSQCNQGMGTMHMRDFIKEYFNENLKKFDKREKPLIKKKKKRLFTFGRG